MLVSSSRSSCAPCAGQLVPFWKAWARISAKTTWSWIRDSNFKLAQINEKQAGKGTLLASLSGMLIEREDGSLRYGILREIVCGVVGSELRDYFLLDSTIVSFFSSCTYRHLTTGYGYVRSSWLHASFLFWWPPCDDGENRESFLKSELTTWVSVWFPSQSHIDCYNGDISYMCCWILSFPFIGGFIVITKKISRQDHRLRGTTQPTIKWKHYYDIVRISRRYSVVLHTAYPSQILECDVLWNCKERRREED